MATTHNTKPIDTRILGAAILQCVVAHAAKVKVNGDHVDANCFFRGGDDLHLRIYPERATWRDIVTGQSGGARDFAQLVGLKLNEFLDRYGSLPASVAKQVAEHKERHTIKADSTDGWWTPGQAAQCWDAHVQHADPARVARMREWLRRTRGIPVDAQIPSGVLPADNRHVPGLEARIWMAGIIERSPCVISPLRNLGGERADLVDGLVLRPAKPGRLKAISAKGIKNGEHPRVFGLVQTALPVKHIVITEGGPDTWTAEALLTTANVGALVIGAAGAEQLPRIARELTSWQGIHVCVVYDVDKAGMDKGIRAAATLKAAGCNVDLFRWSAFTADLATAGCNTSRIKDLSDACQAAVNKVQWATLAQLFVEAANCMETT